MLEQRKADEGAIRERLNKKYTGQRIRRQGHENNKREKGED